MKNRSRGSALIIVLLLLVVMTMASFALMRSSETGTLIAGNMASKQAAVQAGDVGLVAAENALKNLLVNGTVPTNGYANATDANITSKSFSATSIPWSTTATLSNGAKYRYVIEKMTEEYYRVTVEVTHQKGSKNYFEALYSTQ